MPNKILAYSEIFRILKSGGHFCISDIVLNGHLPDKLKQIAELYAGCVAGALQIDDYIEIINKSGFKNVQILKKKPIFIPDDLLSNYLSEEEINEFRASKSQIISITVNGTK